MIAQLRGALLLAAAGVAACGSSPEAKDIPPASGGQGYSGNHASDIWQTGDTDAGFATLLRHWDGAAWTDVDFSASIGRSTVGPIAGPDTIWLTRAIGFDWAMFQLHADGTAEEIAAPPPPEAPYEHGVTYNLSGWGDTILAHAGGTDLEGRATSRLYLREGDAWTPLPALPEGVLFQGVRVGSDGEIMAQATDWTYTASCDAWNDNEPARVQADVVHGAASPWLWLRDGDWVRLSGPRCQSFAMDLFATPNPTFPMDDLWTSSWHFDGARFGALLVPGAMSYRSIYTYVEGETVRISEARTGNESPGEAWSCDGAGNCSPMDTSTFAGTEWVTERWDGSGWSKRRVVAHGQTCVGAGCIYSGDAPGIVGQLQDGTVVIYQSGDGEEPTLALVSP